MFDNHFEVYLADTKESKEIHYSIRYQVYCEEMGFEDKEQYPLEMEYDEDDAKSIHFIVRNKLTGQWVGAMRLINKRNGLLPIEQACELDQGIDTNGIFGTVEMSRLCLVKDARRGGKDLDPPNGIFDETKQIVEADKIKRMPNQHKLNRMIIWGLFHAAALYCFENRMQYCYFMTTAILAKVLQRRGLNLINIGEPCQHRGERYPFKLDAIAGYHSDIWQNDYQKEYRLFSELDRLKYAELVAAA